MSITELKSPITIEDLDKYNYIEILVEHKGYAERLPVKDRRKRILKQTIYSYRLSPDKTEIWEAVQHNEIEPETKRQTGFDGKYWSMGYEKEEWDASPLYDINSSITKKKFRGISPVTRVVGVNKKQETLNSHKIVPPRKKFSPAKKCPVRVDFRKML